MNLCAQLPHRWSVLSLGTNSTVTEPVPPLSLHVQAGYEPDAGLSSFTSFRPAPSGEGYTEPPRLGVLRPLDGGLLNGVRRSRGDPSAILPVFRGTF